MNTPLSDPILKLIHGYRRQLQQATVDAQLNLPASYIRIFKCVNGIEFCTVQLISNRLDRDKAQITRVINELAQKGLIKKQKNPNDQRSQILTLSSEGEEVFKRFRELELKSQEKLAYGLTPEEIKSFKYIAEKMISNLNEL